MNWKNILYLIVTLIIIPIFFKYQTDWIIEIFGIYSVVIIAFGVFTFVLTLFDFFYYLYDILIEWISVRKLKKESNRPKKSKKYYVWLSSISFDEKYFYDILNGFSVDDFLVNLKAVKDKFRVYIGDELGNYYLLRNSLEHIKEDINNFSSIVKTFVIPMIAAGITYVISQSIIDTEVANLFILFFTFQNTISFPLVIAYTLIGTGILLGVIRGLKSLFRFTTLKERKINAILFIINAIISEMEQNEEN